MATRVKDKKPPAAARVKVEDCRLAYADQLITPKAFEAGQQEKFSVTLLMAPDNPAIDYIEEAVETVAEARFGEKADRPKRLRGVTYDPLIKSCSDYPAIGKLPQGWCFIRASSVDAPGIVGPNVEVIARQDLRSEVYSGRRANVSVQLFAYENAFGSGIGVGLGNVQLTRHDERLGAARPLPKDEFDPTELPGEDDDDDEDDLPPTRRPRR